MMTGWHAATVRATASARRPPPALALMLALILHQQPCGEVMASNSPPPPGAPPRTMPTVDSYEAWEQLLHLAQRHADALGGSPDDVGRYSAAARAAPGGTAGQSTAPEGRKWFRSSEEVGVTRCQHKFQLPLRPGSAFGISSADLVVHSFWKMVVTGRRLFVRGFWLYDFDLQFKFKDAVEPKEWNARKFVLRSPNFDTIVALPNITSHDITLAKTEFVGSRSMARSVRALVELPDDVVGLPAQEWLVTMDGSVDTCLVLAWSLGGPGGGHDGAAQPSRPPRITFSVSPMWAPTEEVVPLLLWNMRWHERFGINDYSLYVTRDVLGLASDPRVQEQVSLGRLRLVLWASMPSRDSNLRGGATVTDVWGDHYMFQNVQYNHAMLAAWPLSSHILTADLDEFLYTSVPGTLPEVLSRCAREALPDEMAPVPVLLVQRPVAWCVQDCGPVKDLGRELDLWMDTRPLADADKGASQHPLRHYGVVPLTQTASALLKYGFVHATMFKSVVYASYIDKSDIHLSIPMPKMRTAHEPNGSCAAMLHVVNYFNIRMQGMRGQDPGAAEQYMLQYDQLWPLRRA